MVTCFESENKRQIIFLIPWSFSHLIFVCQEIFIISSIINNGFPRISSQICCYAAIFRCFLLGSFKHPFIIFFVLHGTAYGWYATWRLSSLYQHTYTHTCAYLWLHACDNRPAEQAQTPVLISHKRNLLIIFLSLTYHTNPLTTG